MDLAVEVPRDELGAVASTEMWGEIYDRLAQLAQENRTTLVFVNTRRLSERVAHHLGGRLGENAVLPHHGSLSRALAPGSRAAAEERRTARRGRHRSLELGIDIGTVDLVCQIGSPRSIAVALQRIGRAGHWVGALAQRTPVRNHARRIDRMRGAGARDSRGRDSTDWRFPNAPLDILAQQIVAMCAPCDEWNEDELFAAGPPRVSLSRSGPRSDFDAVVEMLSEGIATSRGRRGAILHRDQVNHRVRGRRGARLTAITNGGAIPDTAQYQVIAEPEGTVVGTLDEDFAIESLAGDIFLLGTTSWRIRRVEPGRVRVEDAHGAAPSIPFWNGEAPGRTRELSHEVSRLREDIAAVERSDRDAGTRMLAAIDARSRASRRIRSRG